MLDILAWIARQMQKMKRNPSFPHFARVLADVVAVQAETTKCFPLEAARKGQLSHEDIDQVPDDVLKERNQFAR